MYNYVYECIVWLSTYSYITCLSAKKRIELNENYKVKFIWLCDVYKTPFNFLNQEMHISTM